MWSAMFHARPRSWVTAMIEVCFRDERPQESQDLAADRASSGRPAVGEQQVRLGAIAPAISTRWRWPPEFVR
jgi:hypothetical protein